MLNDATYIGLDVHQATISIAALASVGKLVMEAILETKAEANLQFIHDLRGSLHVTLEEGTCAVWLYDLLPPYVNQVLVCDPRKNALLQVGNKSDRIDARKPAELLLSNLLRPVYHGEHGVRTLKELSRSYLAISADLARVMTQLKAVYRSWAIACAGKQVYAPRTGPSGWARSAKRVCAAGQSFTTSNSMNSAGCASKYGVNYWPRARNIKRRSCCARFPR
jgi:hypothetical protein